MQLDHDEEMVPMHGMHGTRDADLEVQRTIKRAELSAFLCLPRKATGPTMVHVDNKGIIDGLWGGETKCISKGDGRRLVHQEGFLKSSTSKRIALRRRRSKCRFLKISH